MDSAETHVCVTSYTKLSLTHFLFDIQTWGTGDYSWQPCSATKWQTYLWPCPVLLIFNHAQTQIQLTFWITSDSTCCSMCICTNACTHRVVRLRVHFIFAPPACLFRLFCSSPPITVTELKDEAAARFGCSGGDTGFPQVCSWGPRHLRGHTKAWVGAEELIFVSLMELI